MPACRLPAAGVLRVSGEDAGAFLHGQLTSDVNALASGKAQYSGYCTPKGRLLASFLLWRSGDDYWMQLPTSLAEPIRKRLSMYVLRSRVAITDVTGENLVLGLPESELPALASSMVGAVPAAPLDVVATERGVAIALPGARALVLLARTGAGFAPLPDGITASDDTTEWDRLSVRSGVPVILPQTQDAFVPQMANFDLIGAVSYTKGCYPGQEIVARTHYLGRLKQRLFLAHLAVPTPPEPGDRLYSADLGGQSSGTVVNAAPALGGGFDLLAVIQTASAEAHAVHWKQPDGPTLKLEPLPYPVPR